MVAVEHVRATHSGSGPTKPHRTDAQRQVRRELHRAEVALASSSKDSRDRCNLLDDVATAIAENHRLHRIRDIGRLPEAIEYAKEALEIVPQSRIPGFSAQWKGNICNTLQTVYRMMYDRTGNVRYLNEAVKYGEDALDQMMHYDSSQQLSPSWRRTYGRRKDVLASLFLMRFDCDDEETGGDKVDWRNALTLQASAADDIMGDVASYTQFGAFCNLLVEMAGARDNVQYIEHAIWLRTRLPQKMLRPGEDDVEFSQSNYCENSTLLCRKWYMTGTDEDFNKMIEGSRELVRFESQREKPRDYITDPNNTAHVLRVCGINIAVDVGLENSRWAYHIPTFETAIAIFLRLANMLPMETLAHFDELEFPVHAINYMMEKRWQATRIPAHGFALDDINVHCAQHNACVQSLKAGHNLLSKTTSWASYGLSAGSGKEFWCFDPPSIPLRPPRLLFLDPVTRDNWIRKRNDDGTLELGATDDDVDVLEFCRNYPSESKDVGKSVREYLEDHAEEPVATVNSACLAGAGDGVEAQSSPPAPGQEETGLADKDEVAEDPPPAGNISGTDSGEV